MRQKHKNPPPQAWLRQTLALASAQNRVIEWVLKADRKQLERVIRVIDAE